MEILRNPNNSIYTRVPLTPSDGKSLRRPEVYRVTKTDGTDTGINVNPISVNEYITAIQSLPQEF